MSKKPHFDLDDDQIRFISADAGNTGHKHVRTYKKWWIALVSIIVLAIGAVVYDYYKQTPANVEITVNIEEVPASPVNIPTDTAVTIPAKTYTAVQDTTISRHRFTILTPIGGSPELVIGSDAFEDTTAILTVQAADIRSDNGKIVGACVSKGNLISTGQSKAGFCAIIGGNITIGVADATPYLEQALETGGDFFRQYPLVVGGQVVENKPKGVAFRKALAEYRGKTAVIISRSQLTFHDFSQSLVDLGVTNAIYLVGSKAYGRAVDEDGSTVSFGTPADNYPENISFLVWRK